MINDAIIEMEPGIKLFKYLVTRVQIARSEKEYFETALKRITMDSFQGRLF